MFDKTFLFLDLEETLIDCWENADPLAVGLHRTKVLIDRIRADGLEPVLGLMSWAVWDDRDKERFKTQMRPWIERELGAMFSDSVLWSMDDWCNQIFRYSNKKLSRQDLFDMFGKEECLLRVARFHPMFKQSALVLVDDRVNHMLTVDVPDREVAVMLLNVNQMEDS